MPNKIKPKRSYTSGAVPTTSDLDTHECAINWTDSKLFVKNAAGQIVTVTLGGDGADATLRALFVPPSPTGLTATAGNGQASLSWTAPTGVIAQAPITDYREQYSSDGGTTWTTFTAAASTAASSTITGLTNSTAYVFRVAGVNAAGVGAYSTASSAVTPLATPQPPSNLSLSFGGCDGQWSAAWTASPTAGVSYLLTRNGTTAYSGSGTSASGGGGSGAVTWQLVSVLSGLQSTSVSASSNANNGISCCGDC